MFHLHHTRGRDNLHLELFNSTLGQKSVTYKGTIFWNTLPDELKCVKSTRSFTNRLKNLLSLAVTIEGYLGEFTWQ